MKMSHIELWLLMKLLLILHYQIDNNMISVNRTLKLTLASGIVFSAMLMTGCHSEENDGPEIITDKPLSQYNSPVANPWLASSIYSITHFNSAQTDAFPYAVKDGIFNVNPNDCESSWSGPVNLMTIASTSSDYMWGVGSDRVSYIKVSNGDFKKVAEAAMPGTTMRTKEGLEKLTANYSSIAELESAVKEVLGAMPQAAIANGNYVLCDCDNNIYVNAGRIIAVYSLIDKNDPSKGIQLDGQIDMTPHIFGSYTIMGVSMSYDGYLLVASQRGLVSVDRALSGIIDSYPFGDDQILTNSISNDENGGVYVASNSTTSGGKGIMRKLICKNGNFSDKESDGAWNATYDGGPEAPAIKHGFGTGSTPTLMGFGDEEDKLVVITDGSKRMKLVAFWRDDIPADAKAIDPSNPRLADAFEVSCGLPSGTEWVQSEQSVVAGGYDAFVVNNIDAATAVISDKMVGVLAIGPLTPGPKGAECVRWNVKENKWESKWTRTDVSSISMIPSVSIPSEMVFVNGYDNDGWVITGMDWKTGETRQRVSFGKNNRGNGAYAVIQYLPDGSLLFNSVSGPFRVNFSKKENDFESGGVWQ